MKKIILVFITTIIFICSSIANYSKSINTGLANNMIRLHVVANSNSKNDQLLKLKVRDRILEYTNTLLKDSKNIDETKYIISQTFHFPFVRSLSPLHKVLPIPHLPESAVCLPFRRDPHTAYYHCSNLE